MIPRITFLILCFVLTLGSALTPGSLLAQNRIATGQVMELYQQHCAVCHGTELEGGLGGPLVGKEWRWAKNEDELEEVIRDGLPDVNMQAFGDVLSNKEIRALVVLMHEKNLKAGENTGSVNPVDFDDTVETRLHGYRIESVVTGLEHPWAFTFFADGRMLISERPGRLRIFSDGELLAAVEGTPEVWAAGQGGLLDVALHPEYEDNGWIYLSFSESVGEQNGRSVGMLSIVRGRIVDNKWVDEEEIFRVEPRFHTSRAHHFGTRLVLKDGYLFFAIGDRGAPSEAQDLSLPNGKIHRIHDDGRVPSDNPFVDDADAYPTIWAYGNRNPQGLDFHPVSGDLWEAEHGPRGGDEINLIRSGRNYGWPEITHGINYNGSPITEHTAAEGMEQPVLYWTPSISVCGIEFYRGDAFPEWKHNLIAGGLASQQLHRLVINDKGEVVESEIILAGIGRIRDVGNGPDGAIYIILNGPDLIVRLLPLNPVD